jgi:hypothetical protein
MKIVYLYNKVKTSEWMVKVLTILFTFHFSLITSSAQDKIVNPDIS